MKTIEHIVSVMTVIFVAAAMIVLGPMLFGIRPYVVLSGSMNPAIKTGSLAYVYTKADPDSLREGNIAAFRLGGSTVTHRVIGVDEDRIYTKGDANDTADEFVVKKSDVVGRTIFSIPLLGYIIDGVKLPFVLAAVMILCGFYAFTVLSNNYIKRERGGNGNVENS